MYNNTKYIKRNKINEQTKKLATIFLLAAVIFLGGVLSTIPVQYAASQLQGNQSNVTDTTGGQIKSIPENTASDLESISNAPSFEVIPGKPIQPIPNSFIVKLKPSEAGTFDMSSLTASISSDLQAVGGNITEQYDELGYLKIQFGEEQPVDTLAASNITITPEQQQLIETLRNNPAVEEVYNDAIVSIQAQVLPNDVNRVDADMSLARSGDGFGSVNADIGILDTGVQFDHPDLNVFKCVSFVLNPIPGVPLSTCSDGHGHGTHVAGTAAAKDNDIGVVGKAPGARIWAIKVLSDSGSGTFSDILEGLNYVAKNAGQIDVINLSLGGIGSFPPAEDAITKLVKKKGVTVVLAAGNSNMNTLGFTPAKTIAAITVSAMTDTDGKCGGVGIPHARTIPIPPGAVSYGNDDSFASFSNHGSVVDMAAPGVDVFSTYKGSGYAKMSGTSMAAPNVAGAAALYKSINPTASPDEVETFLAEEATQPAYPLVGNHVCNSDGKGYFDNTNDDDNEREPLLYMK